ncbi:MAG: hypothetical protein CM15mV25_0780 [uncultured marine virus]|nr:MAG: hypothetical protein CM15mV25_0780 [uncultured marine virus]
MNSIRSSSYVVLDSVTNTCTTDTMTYTDLYFKRDMAGLSARTDLIADSVFC